jgi:hypothetical protein
MDQVPGWLGAGGVARSPALSAGRRHGPPRDIGTFLGHLREINYFPTHGGWSYMWQYWNAPAVDADLSRIAGLHATAVRIIIPALVFGYPRPQTAMQARLSQAIALAAAHGLRVHLTLFDWWGAYGDLTGSEQWAGSLLAPYRDDGRIAVVELKNELDADNPAAASWARVMIPYLRSLSGTIPVTISAASLEKLQSLVTALHITPPDFYTFHCYTGSEPALTYSVLQQAQQIVPRGRLFIGETGFSTTPGNYGLPVSAAALEAEQDHFFRTVDYATSALGLPPAAPWDLNDFAAGAIPPGTTAARPVEYHYGLLRADGSEKPAALATARFFATGAVDLSFNNGFESGFDGAGGPLPTEWGLWHADEAHFALDRSIAHSGGASARISASSGDPSGVPAFYVSPINANVTPDRTYTASAWVAGRAATGTNRVALAWFDAGKHYLGLTSSALLPTGTSTWMLLSAVGVAPAGAAFVQIHLQSASNSGAVWFDDVSFH